MPQHCGRAIVDGLKFNIRNKGRRARPTTLLVFVPHSSYTLPWMTGIALPKGAISSSSGLVMPISPFYSERTVDQCIALRRMNAALPFCKLPPEICSRVFYALAAIDSPFHPIPPKRFHEDYILHGPGYPSGKDDRPTTFGWINLTHVCYVWRNAAFGYASIWKNIPSTFGWRCAQ